MKGKEFKIISLCTAIALLIALSITCATTSTNYPTTFVRTYDEPGVWKSIEVKEGINKEDSWRTVVDALSQQFDLEVVAKDSGYIRSSWQLSHAQRMTTGGECSGTVVYAERYRSRITVKFLGEDWKILQVKCESQWLDPYKGWIVGYDTRLLEDVYGDLQGRVGRVRR